MSYWSSSSRKPNNGRHIWSGASKLKFTVEGQSTATTTGNTAMTVYFPSLSDMWLSSVKNKRYITYTVTCTESSFTGEGWAGIVDVYLSLYKDSRTSANLYRTNYVPPANVSSDTEQIFYKSLESAGTLQTGQYGVISREILPVKKGDSYKFKFDKSQIDSNYRTLNLLFPAANFAYHNIYMWFLNCTKGDTVKFSISIEGTDT